MHAAPYARPLPSQPHEDNPLETDPGVRGRRRGNLIPVGILGRNANGRVMLMTGAPVRLWAGGGEIYDVSIKKPSPQVATTPF